LYGGIRAGFEFLGHIPEILEKHSVSIRNRKQCIAVGAVWAQCCMNNHCTTYADFHKFLRRDYFHGTDWTLRRHRFNFVGFPFSGFPLSFELSALLLS
jgi:hypothetical protein